MDISEAHSDLPLVIDLDNTLLRTDTLLEAIVQLLKKNFLYIFYLPIWLLKGRAAFKQSIAELTQLTISTLPYHTRLLDYLHTEKQRGRKLILATATNHMIAHQVATHLNLFDEVLASTATHNLKGINKLQLIQQRIGQQFVYAGDSVADLPIWRAAQAAILVCVPAKLAKQVRHICAIEKEFPAEKITWAIWKNALRLHQWLKNLLLFVPLLTAFSFLDIEKTFLTFIAFIAFSLCASATYMMNDIWDIEHDRQHPRKKQRPFASGLLSIKQGIFCEALLLISSFAIAYTVSSTFALLLLLYLLCTSAYSLCLKKYVLLDVITLSLLYTLRIFVGSVVTDISISNWLLAFAIFSFLSLALLKRYAELVSLAQRQQHATPGRDYLVSDLSIIFSLGISTSLAAIIVFGLFLHAPETMTRYSSPHALWGAAISLFYLFARLWIQTARGQMHDDPIVHILEDQGSRYTIYAILAIVLTAHLL